MKEIRFNDRMWFGKYKGLRIYEIIDSNPSYISKILKENNLFLDEKSKNRLFGDKKSIDVSQKYRHNQISRELINDVDEPMPSSLKIKKSRFSSHNDRIMGSVDVGVDNSEHDSVMDILPPPPPPPTSIIKKYKMSFNYTGNISFNKHIICKIISDTGVIGYDLEHVSNIILIKLEELNLPHDNNNILINLFFLKNCERNIILNGIIYMSVINNNNNNLIFDGQFTI